MKPRKMRWLEHVAHIGQRKGICRVLVGKPEGKSPLGKPRHRWEDNFKVDLKEIGWKGVGWIDLTRDRDRWRAIINMLKNLCVP